LDLAKTVLATWPKTQLRQSISAEQSDARKSPVGREFES
jgi:hypothetical protein